MAAKAWSGLMEMAASWADMQSWQPDQSRCCAARACLVILQPQTHSRPYRLLFPARRGTGWAGSAMKLVLGSNLQSTGKRHKWRSYGLRAIQW